MSRATFTENGVEKMRMTVTFVPHAECSETIQITGTLPNDSSGQYSVSKKFYYQAFYDEYDFEIEDLTAEGAFTEFTKDTYGAINGLSLTDGETAVFSVRIKNENASGEITGVEWVAGNSNGWTDDEKAYIALSTTEESSKEMLCRLKHSNDVVYSSENKKTTHGEFAGAYNTWEKDEKIVKDNDKSTSLYSDDFLEACEDAGIGYWLVSRELVYTDDNGNQFFSFYHEDGNGRAMNYISKNDYKWERGQAHVHRARHEPFNHMWEDWDYWHDWISLKIKDEQVLFKQNGSGWGNQKRGSIEASLIDISEHLDYWPCEPYVITTKELKNSLFCLENTSLNSTLDASNNQNDNHWYAHLPQVLHEYITPTLSKDTTGTQKGTGTITISYTLAKNSAKTDVKTFNVKVVERKCEAYTNNGWKKQSVTYNGETYHRFVLPGSENVLISGSDVPPSFRMLSDNADFTRNYGDIKNSDIKIKYKISPKDADVYLTLPKPQDTDTGICMIMADLTTVSTLEDGSVKYKITESVTDENGYGIVTIPLRFSGSYSGSIVLETDSLEIPKRNRSKEIPVSITTNDNTVPVITSQKATEDLTKDALNSTVDAPSKIIYLGDGETIEGYFTNYDEDSPLSIIGLEYEELTKYTTPRAPVKWEDWYGDDRFDNDDDRLDYANKSQNSYVSAGITAPPSADGVYYFTVKHELDYDGSHIKIGKDRYTYKNGPSNTTYRMQYDADPDDYEIHAVASYYYENYKAQMPESWSDSPEYDGIPVGRFIIKFGLVNDDGSVKEYKKDEIFVFVRINNSKCTASK